MKITVSDYEVNYKPFLQFYEDNKEDKSLVNIVSSFSVYSGCPIIVVIHFAERFIKTPELINYKEVIIDFYKYTEINDE